MAATYRITLKGWDRQYGEGHVLDSRRFEVKRRSKKADKEAVELLEDMMRRHPPQKSDRSAFAWAEVSDRYGPTTLAKYTNDNGEWVGAARPELRSNAEGDPPWLETIEIDRDPRDSTLFGYPALFGGPPATGIFRLDQIIEMVGYLESATGRVEAGRLGPMYEGHAPFVAGKEHLEIFVDAPDAHLVPDLDLPLPGNVKGWVAFRESTGPSWEGSGGVPDPVGVEVGATIWMTVDWRAAAESLIETIGLDLESDDMDEFAVRLEESPPGRELSKAVGREEMPFSRSADPVKLLPGIADRTPGAYYPGRSAGREFVDWYEIISDYLTRVEEKFSADVDKGAEDLYEWAVSVLSERIEAAELPGEPARESVFGELTGPTETPLAMNARRSRLATRRERIERSTEGIHSLLAQLDEPERTRLEQCIEQCETEEQVRAVTARFAKNARRKRKRKKRGAAHETETAEERTERLRRQRSEWENVTN